ncbi:MAG: hypothetical protein P8Y51_10580, partial [Campylobacterales bacterium]
RKKQKKGANMAPQESAEIKALKQEIEALKNDLSKLTETLQQIAAAKEKEKAENIKEEILSKIPDDQKEKIEALRAEGEKAVDAIKTQQEQHPMGTLLVAAGIGFLIGKVFGTKD